MLHDVFISLAAKYNNSLSVAESMWRELHDRYDQEERPYHNLSHLINLHTELLKVKKAIRDWDAILFMLFYHDIIYYPLRDDNEQESAELAVLRMKTLLVPDPIIEKCKAGILATKDHRQSDDSDVNLFLDSDLAILGAEWEQYFRYCLNIRKEYSVFPQEQYNEGRQRVLNSFSGKPSIFKTNYFIHLYEKQARENIEIELKLLSGD